MTAPCLIVLHQENSTPGRIAHALRTIRKTHAIGAARRGKFTRLIENTISQQSTMVMSAPGAMHLAQAP
jgi:hypothetical protein